MDYLFRRGKKGIYYYSRRVPKDVAKAFGAEKVTKSLKTAICADAVVKAKAIDLECEKQWQAIRGAEKPKRFIPDAKAKRQAFNQLIDWGAHPTQEPRLSEFSHREAGKMVHRMDEFLEAWNKWLSNVDIALEIATGLTDDSDTTNNTKLSPVLSSFMDQMQGKDPLPACPTWSEAFDLYMTEIRKKKPKADKQEAARTRTEYGYAKRVAEFLGKGNLKTGWNKPLDEITRGETIDFYDWYLRTYPNNKASSWNKVAGSGHKVFKTATGLLGLQLPNPFSDLSVPEKNKDARREFTPSELALLQEAIVRWKNSNPEWYLISALMLATGCRTSCAWGLTFEDLKLGRRHPIPHLWFRSNNLRSLDKGMHDRPMVLLDPLMSDLKAWAESFNAPTAKDPVFPLTVKQPKSTDWVSKRQTALLRELGIKPDRGQPEPDPKVTWYSARHTFVTRAEQTDVRAGLRHYIVGQQSNETTAIHQRYIGHEPLTEIRDALLKINEVKNWGYFWSPDDAF